jgi:DNA-binding GntR family transcriptional regulator
MEAAAQRNDVKDLIESDLAFHLALAAASNNVVLIEALNRLLRPLFGFVLLRMMETHETAISWEPDLPRHRRMIELIRDSDPRVAKQYVEHCVGAFVASAHRVWWPETQRKRRRS